VIEQATIAVDSSAVSGGATPVIDPAIAARVRALLLAWAMPVEEAVAWVALTALTLVLHLALLGSPPLNVDEGRRAMEAYRLLEDGAVAYDGAPLLANATSLVFTLFTDGDRQARLIPALSGVPLVLTPLLLRPLIPGWWSLLAALGLASSPTLLTASRSMSPAVPAALCLALTALAAWRFGASYSGRWLTTLLVAGFVGIGIDTSFMVGLAGLLLAYAIAEGEIFGKVPWWEPLAKHGRRSLAIAVGVAVVLDTRLLMNPAGLQAGLIDSLWHWTDDITRGAGLTAPVLAALLDGGLLVLALIGLSEYKRYPRAVRFFGTWLLVSLTLAALMRMPDLRYLSQPLIPAAMLGGLGLLRLATWLVEAGSARTTVLGIAALVPVVTAAFQTNAGLRQNLSPWGASGVVLLAGLILSGLLAFNLLRGAQLGAAFATWLLVLVSLGSVAGGSRALEARMDDRGQLVEQTVVTADMRYVREMVQKWRRAAPEEWISVDGTLQPVVAWALRDIPNVRYEPTMTRATGPRLSANPPSQMPPDTTTYRPIVGYAADWQTLSLQPARIWRWMVNRESLVTLRPYAIVVVQLAGG
jgi:hypothetical protein